MPRPLFPYGFVAAPLFVAAACLVTACSDDSVDAGTSDTVIGTDLGEGDTGASVADDVASAEDTNAPNACPCDPAKSTVCAENRCVGGACSLVARPAGTPCDDGEPCTVGDICKAGSCAAGATNQCGCATDADCATKDDKNACNGVLFCDKTAFAWACKTKPGSVIDCKDTAKPCRVNACDPKNGMCADKDAPDDTACSDGKLCTANDSCVSGTCKGVQLCQCESAADCATKEDGNLCNGTLYCDLATHSCALLAASIVKCDTGQDSTCSKNTCDPATGTCAPKNAKDGTACEDADTCSANDACKDGKCAGTDICSCKKNADCAKQEDGNSCNGSLYCDVAKGTCAVNPKTVVTCPTNNDTDCVKNACVPATGLCALKAVKALTSCDDGDTCTKGDHCIGGGCKAGENTCKCKSNSDCAGLDDGDLCNGTLFCDKSTGVCAFNPASIVNCKSVDDTACAHSVCLPKSGTCTMAPRADTKLTCETTKDAQGNPKQLCAWHLKKAGEPGDKGPFACDDNDPCTSGEACIGASCKASAVTCKCKKNADCEAADDGNVCNGVFYCDKSLKVPDCVFNPASKVFCTKKNDTVCLGNACDPKTGACSLQPTKLGTTCDDGNACTVGDGCANGSCVAKNKRDCDDNNACTVDSCLAKTGCAHKTTTCDDGNECTADTCDKKTGHCAFKSQPPATICNADNNGCTVNDSCNAGVCKVGKKVICAAPTKACETSVCLSSGPATFKCLVVPRSDGTPCPDAKNACLAGASCNKGKCTPGLKARQFIALPYSATEDAWLQSVALTPDDRIVAAGGRTVGSWSKPTDRRWLVISLDRFGKTQWVFEDKPAAASATHWAASVINDTAGAVWVAGMDRVKNDPQVKVVRLLASGKVERSWHIDDNSPVTSVEDMARLDNGELVVAFRTSFFFGTFVFSVVDKMSITGTKLFHTFHQGWTRPRVSVSGDRLATVAQGAGKLLFDIRSVKDMKQIGHTLAPWPGAVDTVALPGGQNGVVHGTATRQATMVTVVRPDATQGLRSHQLPADHVTGAATAVAGNVIAVGHTTAGKGFMARQDALGNNGWRRTFATKQPARLVAVDAKTLDDAVAVGWLEPKKGPRRPLLVKTGPFGNASCQGLGKCAAKTGADCDDGKPCTTDDCNSGIGCVNPFPVNQFCIPKTGCGARGNCKAGACQEADNGRWHHAKFNWSGMQKAPVGGITALPGDKLRVYVNPQGVIAPMIVDASGSNDYDGPQDHCYKQATAHGMMPLPGGGVAVAVELGALKPKRAGVCRLAGDGKGFSRFSWTDCSGCDTAARDVVEFADGTLYAATSNSAGFTRVVRFTATGKTVWIQVTPSTSQPVLHALVNTDDSGVVAVGRLAPSKKKTAWLLGLDHQGKQRFSTVVSQHPMGELRAVAFTKTGAVVAAGTVVPNGSSRGSLLVAANGKSGKVLWTRPATPLDQATGLSVLPSDGGLMIAGDIFESGRQKVFLERVTSAGQRVWRRTYLRHRLYNGRLGPGALAAWSDGYVLGVYNTNAWDYPETIRTDKHGHAGCFESGICVANKSKNCDDNNPCTADWCHAKSGCQHTKISGCK